MIDSNYIIKSIDQTCALLGGEAKLVNMGYDKVVGYISMISQINRLTVHRLANILHELHKTGGIYSDFAHHILHDSVLHDGFFTFDSELNPADDNLQKMFEDLIEEKNVSQKKEEQDNKSIDYRFLYEKAQESGEILNTNLDSTYDPNFSKDQNKPISASFTKEYNNRLEGFKQKVDSRVLFWLENNVPNMSDDDYGMLMALIFKMKNEERE